MDSNTPPPVAGAQDGPLWSDERISRWVYGLTKLQSNQMTDAMRRVRDDYEQARQQERQTIATLQAAYQWQIEQGERIDQERAALNKRIAYLEEKNESLMRELAEVLNA